jgi:hypothetical protein
LYGKYVVFGLVRREGNASEEIKLPWTKGRAQGTLHLYSANSSRLVVVENEHGEQLVEFFTLHLFKKNSHYSV